LVAPPAPVAAQDEHRQLTGDGMDVETELYIGLPGRENRPNKVAVAVNQSNHA
jgi:hypothetical protein